MTTADLLEAWREATRAAELAERLAGVATESADRAETHALASEEIADLAEQAAAAATRAAERARNVATRARELASDISNDQVPATGNTLKEARAVESDARDQYHEAERKARQR